MFNIQCFSKHITQVVDLEDEKLCSLKILPNDFMHVSMCRSFLSLPKTVAK